MIDSTADALSGIVLLGLRNYPSGDGGSDAFCIPYLIVDAILDSVGLINFDAAL